MEREVEKGAGQGNGQKGQREEKVKKKKTDGAQSIIWIVKEWVTHVP